MKHNRPPSEKYPRKLYADVFAASLIFAVLGIELYLFITTPEEKAISEIINIRLKEYPPSTIRQVVPNDGFMRKTDGLVQRSFRLESDIMKRPRSASSIGRFNSFNQW